MEEIVCYGLYDANGILINAVAVNKDDFGTLELLKTEHEADGYQLIDPDLYVVRVGQMRWNGVYWEKAVAS